MKNLFDKFLVNISRSESILLIIPFICWVFCYRYFFTGHLDLQQDAVSYATDIVYYTDNLSKGVFPLWNTGLTSGVPYDFFLRRIGDVNPLLFLIILLKWFGVSSATAYLVFLGMYYFLAGWAFYLITRFLLVDRFYAFSAYILFLFSSWGSEIFYNYIIIIFVPLIWFFYFLLCFCRSCQKGPLLGMCFCCGLVLTTYIPFFFLTILVIFSALFVLFYGNVIVGIIKRSLTFFCKNKLLTIFCIAFLLASCVPALLFYKESKTNEFVMPNRHSGADSALPIAVSLNSVASGDIVNHGFFDRIFDDHKHLDMGDIYIPYFLFIFLLSATFARASRLIFFLLFNILALSLISITSAAGIHRFLYAHIIFFKLIRNIYYFFWLAILPMSILLSVTAFKSLLSAIDNTSRRTAWLTFIIICHLAFAFFLWHQQGVLSGAWAAVIISMVYFLVYFFYDKKISYSVGFCLIFLAVLVQSAQVYGFLENRMYQIQKDSYQFAQLHKSTKKVMGGLYYTTRWFDVLNSFIDPDVLERYTAHKFIVYDSVVPFTDSSQFLKTFESNIASNTNIAYLSKYESDQNDWVSNPDANPQADSDPVASGKLSVLKSDDNTWNLKTHFPISQFLVINDNYNSDWHVTINGHPARLFRANISFKGLWVPAGDSSIVLHFSKPMRFAFHFILIILFAGMFLYLLVSLKNERKRPETLWPTY